MTRIACSPETVSVNSPLRLVVVAFIAEPFSIIVAPGKGMLSDNEVTVPLTITFCQALTSTSLQGKIAARHRLRILILLP
ncbi:MAG: hypothetical protein MUC93_10570 [Bacteroidales bacterium]|nr:hypothetical protein [Bacteroidales bacterium]